MTKALPLVLVAGVAAFALAKSRRAEASTNAATVTPASPDPVAVVDNTDINAWSVDVDVLARTIWGEARGEGYTGMQAVANVIMNRYATAVTRGGYWWGNTIQDICLKHSGNVYQFSAWSPNDVNYAQMLAVTPYDAAFRDALELATLALTGQLRDVTRGATNYFAPDSVASTPVWARGQVVLAQIGNHEFYAVG